MQLGSNPICKRCLADYQSSGGFLSCLSDWAEKNEIGLWASLASLFPQYSPIPSHSIKPVLSPRFDVRIPSWAARSEGGAALRHWEERSPLPWPIFYSGLGLEFETGSGDVPSLDKGTQVSQLKDPWDGLWREAPPPNAPKPYLAVVLGNARLTNPDWAQEVRSISLGSWQDVYASGSARGSGLSSVEDNKRNVVGSIPTWHAGDVAIVIPGTTPLFLLFFQHTLRGCTRYLLPSLTSCARICTLICLSREQP